MSDVKKHVFGEFTKGIACATLSAVLILLVQYWSGTDLEFKYAKRDAYLPGTLESQGLIMFYNGQPLKNVSVVEFLIINRTKKQFSNVDLVFSFEEKDKPTLVSSGVIPPSGMSNEDFIEEREAKSPNTKIFRIKTIPKRESQESFQALFVFKGPEAPQMSLNCISCDVSIVPYRESRDNAKIVAILVALFLIYILFLKWFFSIVDHTFGLFRHKKRMALFRKHFDELKTQRAANGQNEPDESFFLETVNSFQAPAESKFWGKFIPRFGGENDISKDKQS